MMIGCTFGLVCIIGAALAFVALVAELLADVRR